MWQDIVVGAVVLLAGLYALWYWLPAVLRRRLGAVRPALAQKPGCGSCSDCGGCAAPASALQPAPGSAPAPLEAQPRDPVWMAQRR